MSTQAKHTPGPWRIDHNYKGIEQIGPLCAEGDALDDSGLVAWLDVSEADAALIARAPDMAATITRLEAEKAELVEALKVAEARITATSRAFYVDGKRKALMAAFGDWKNEIEPIRAILKKHGKGE